MDEPIKYWPIAMIVAFASIWIIHEELKRRKRLSDYWSRSCSGSQWRRCFPAASDEVVREFLEGFAWAFGFNRKKCLKFQPDDRVMKVFRTIYPEDPIDDGGELDRFGKILANKYHLDLEKRWSPELTLGEIFAMTLNGGNGHRSDPTPAKTKH